MVVHGGDCFTINGPSIYIVSYLSLSPATRLIFYVSGPVLRRLGF
ncbi:hypothetical protein M8C21_021030 [Ambrosia artemisiifolia]|uniref:Uncharacterized protein n=1 Tax=Ambrosia artemisiifolia TaxID=4212 RepID=A0AAD5BPJ7_AMBAR|nr:hypothetical protein M8C21_021030 [Ambrosia artemisiifolia]